MDMRPASSSLLSFDCRMVSWKCTLNTATNVTNKQHGVCAHGSVNTPNAHTNYISTTTQLLTLIIFWSRISVRIQLNRNTDVMAPRSALNTAIMTHKSLVSPSASYRECKRNALCVCVHEREKNQWEYLKTIRLKHIVSLILTVVSALHDVARHKTHTQIKTKHECHERKRKKKRKLNSIRTSQFNSSFRNLQFARSLHCKDLSMHVSSSQSNSSSPHANVVFFPSTGFFFVNAV